MLFYLSLGLEAYHSLLERAQQCTIPSNMEMDYKLSLILDIQTIGQNYFQQ